MVGHLSLCEFRTSPLSTTMFFGFRVTSLVTTVRSSLVPAAGSYRMFSATHVVEAGYKLKSHSGAKKRWRSLASGTSFKRVGFHLRIPRAVHLTFHLSQELDIRI